MHWEMLYICAGVVSINDWVVCGIGNLIFILFAEAYVLRDQNVTVIVAILIIKDWVHIMLLLKIKKL